MRVVPIIFVMLCQYSLLAGQNVRDQWKLADDAYRRKEYDTATDFFLQVVNKQPGAAAMYNLANAYLEQGDLGNAILWYERALKLKPKDADIRHNLKLAKSRMPDAIVEVQGFSPARILKSSAGFLSPWMWATLSLISLWTGIGLGILRIRGHQKSSHRWIMIGSAAVFGVSLILGHVRKSEISDHSDAVVMNTAKVTIAPDALSTQLLEAGAGEKVTVLDSLGEFYKIRLANYEQGWMQKAAVVRI